MTSRGWQEAKLQGRAPLCEKETLRQLVRGTCTSAG